MHGVGTTPEQLKRVNSSCCEDASGSGRISVATVTPIEHATQQDFRPKSNPFGANVMTLYDQALNSAIPDLRDVPLERLAELGDSVLANSIALYRQRLEDNSVPVYRFNSGI
jgi:FXSXX-COOH protein